MKRALKQFTKHAQGTWLDVTGYPINAYWWKERVNFGDLITPALLKSYGLTPRFEKPAMADLVSTGSVLQQLPSTFSGIVLGSGLIEDRTLSLPHARFLAVRGELSRDRSGAPSDTVLGDPGLLSGRLLSQKAPKKKHSLGLIPHYSDKDDPALQQWLLKQAQTVHLIDVERQPHVVINDIAQCNSIVSSSLHGIIAAHALGIPAMWLKISDRLKGGDFKFRDYASSLSMQLPSVQLDINLTVNQMLAKATQPDQLVLAERQRTLDSLFQKIVSEVKEFKHRDI